MPALQLTSEAKSRLSKTIRSLRAQLLDDLHNAADSAYRLSLPIEQAGLGQAAETRRQRLETWLDEQVRGANPSEKAKAEVRHRFRKDAEQLAAATLINRLIVIKRMEASGLIAVPVVTGGWQSKAYKQFREFAGPLLDDETEGFGVLLQLLYDELAFDMPGLFGNVGLTSLFPVPAATLRAVITALNDPELDSAWQDDTTLGWVYQYWNDPKREELDAKIADGKKIEPHEIASKTQMFTERYMVEWLLHNSLGQMWLAMCKKHGWPAEVVADGTLDHLEARRIDWRQKREAGEVTLEALMPIETEAEERWKYYVPQPMPEDSVTHAPESVRTLKILDPACGSGHFLVIAFDLLVALYQEEARHRGETWTDKEIAESILENNLHGVDIDPRAVQIAAAAVMLKAKERCKDAAPRHLNLVASNLQLASLPDNDPALIELRQQIKDSTGIPEDLTNSIIHALKGADHLGTLLKVDAAVDEAIRKHEKDGLVRAERAKQGNLFTGFEETQTVIGFDEAKTSVLEGLERFLDTHTSGDELGLRLRGEQLAAGIRFIRVVKEDTYDIVVGNPPYQGTSKMADAAYVAKKYPRGKADLYAAFLERGLQLVRKAGVLSMVTMNGWMFIKQFSPIRKFILDECHIETIVDLMWCAFENMRHSTVAMYSILRTSTTSTSVGLVPTPRDEREESNAALERKRSAVLAQVGRHDFDPAALKVVPEWPLVYWWDAAFLKKYESAPLIGKVSAARFGLTTGNNERFVQSCWETGTKLNGKRWAPFILGARGLAWIDPLRDLIRWHFSGIEVKIKSEHQYGTVSKQIRNENTYFTLGVAFSMIGANFSARVHRQPSIIGNMGSSVFPEDIAQAVCSMNSQRSRTILQSINPGIHFEVGDVNRLPLFPIADADTIFATIEAAFGEHESHREPSVEFESPGPSPWRYAQDWAQRSVDRPDGEPLPPYEPEYDPEPATDHVSFALGMALGRFGAQGEGILDTAPPDALPHGICYLSASGGGDSLSHPATQLLRDTWTKLGSQIAPDGDLSKYLRAKFFGDVHKKMYENRPIYFPLSSSKKSFVAYVSIHRWHDQTLPTLLADHLVPEQRRIEGELADLQAGRNAGDAATRNRAEKRFTDLSKLKDELDEFVSYVRQCDEQGPPPAKPTDTPRETDAKYVLDLDDGVMINSAALWPLLEPQWKDPRTWWSELCNAKGRKDYDWAHLAKRYFPVRVDAKCQKDPSLGVAHGCFWQYHPQTAYKWELRLQDEIGPDFTLDEVGSDEARKRFETEQPDVVLALQEAEFKRRERKKAKGQDDEAESDSGDTDEAADDEG